MSEDGTRAPPIQWSAETLMPSIVETLAIAARLAALLWAAREERLELWGGAAAEGGVDPLALQHLTEHLAGLRDVVFAEERLDVRFLLRGGEEPDPVGDVDDGVRGHPPVRLLP